MNIIDAMQSRLEAIETQLKKLDKSFALNEADVWQKGWELPCKILNMSETYVKMNIDNIPHTKILDGYYFNAVHLEMFAKENKNKVQGMRICKM